MRNLMRCINVVVLLFAWTALQGAAQAADQTKPSKVAPEVADENDVFRVKTAKNGEPIVDFRAYTTASDATLLSQNFFWIFIITIVGIVCYSRYRREAMRHKTMVAMIEKGLPIPPELFQPEKMAKIKSQSSDLRRGFAWIGISR